MLPIDRVAADRLYYSGKHKKHGMNVQVLTDPFGRLLWASPALPGAVHDIKAARTHGIIDALTAAGVRCWADKGYQGARGTVRVPYRGRWAKLSAGQKAVNLSHAKIRAVGEQAMATLKGWRLLRKLRCSPRPHHQHRQSRPRPAPQHVNMRLEKAHWRHIETPVGTGDLAVTCPTGVSLLPTRLPPAQNPPPTCRTT